jgi:solute carrier family 35 protein E1
MFESPVDVMPDSVAGHAYTPGGAAAAAFAYPSNGSSGVAVVGDTKKSDDPAVVVGVAGRALNGGGGGRNRGMSNAAWRPPGTRQEDTWREGDGKPAAAVAR